MEWRKLTVELPVKDENGQRPERDENGAPRPVEDVAYTPLEDLEFVLNTFARAADRAWLHATMENLRKQKALSASYALDLDATFRAAIQKYVSAVRVDDEEYRGEEVWNGLAELCEYEDKVTILNFLLNESLLKTPKKKSWKQRFGSRT